MELPNFLPEHLLKYSLANNDIELFSLFIKNRHDFIEFFAYAADQETWSETHGEFLRLTLDWFTQHFFQNQLSIEDAQKIAKKVQEHFPVLSIYLPKNIAFDVSGIIFFVNSLMFGAASPLFHALILHEYRDLNQNIVKLPGMIPSVFRTIEEFVTIGNLNDLWKHSEEELIQIQAQATSWGFDDLSQSCEKILARYVVRGNVYEKLIEAHKNHWYILQAHCCAFINNLDLGCRLSASFGSISFEFLEFIGSALDIFENVNHIITHLIFRKNLLEDVMFRDVVNRCPHLIGLDIDDSRAYDDNLQFVPKSILELDISSCGWLKPQYFSFLALAFPNLKKLIIQNNILLNYSSWSQLELFTELEYLDISRNTQITDDDFKIILQVHPKLTDLKADDCRHITDRGFLEIKRDLPLLTVLSLERTEISDGTLIEIIQYCPYLKELNLARCQKITDKGIWDVVRQSKSLRELNISQTEISTEMIKQTKNLKPFLKITT